MQDNNEQINVEAIAVQLLDAIDGGTLNPVTLGSFSYIHLWAVYNCTMDMENGRDYYKKIKTYIENINIQRLRQKEKIIVAFIANYSSGWPGNELYELLLKSDRFEPWVFVMANPGSKQPRETVMNEYSQNMAFFKSMFQNVVGTQNEDTGEPIPKNDLPLHPDILIWTTSWSELFTEEYSISSWGLDVLYAYIPYGFMAANSADGSFVYKQYDKLIHNLSWKIFEESNASLRMAEKYAYVGASNAVYTGYPKMDSFYNEAHIKQETDIWTDIMAKSQNRNARKIIYAPHHSMQPVDMVCFSTFAKNHFKILDLARQFDKETIWVFKPHPNLKQKALREHVFSSEAEWDSYVDAWKNGKNTGMYDEGNYHRLFVESDAMILDSVSFLSEYLYVHKPILFLRRPEQCFNDYGTELIKNLYQVQGDDIDGIRTFIAETVIKGNDVKARMREDFFMANLDYVHAKGKLASENIFDVLNDTFN